MDQKLTTLLTLIETGSYTQAAKQLSLTQPAVSQHISRLESEFGIKLFNRVQGQYILTEEGKIVVQYAHRAQVLEASVRQKLIDHRSNQQRFTIGVTHTTESNILVDVIAKYCDLHDGIKINIISDDINILYSRLKAFAIDIAFVEGRIADPGFSTVLLDTDSLILAVSPQHPFAKRGSISILELQQEKLIMRLPDSGTRKLFESHLISRNLSIEDFNVILEIDNIATIKDLIRKNFGVSILAKSACQDELNKKKLVALPIEDLSMIREINIVYHKDFTQKAFLNDIIRLYYEESHQAQRSRPIS